MYAGEGTVGIQGCKWHRYWDHPAALYKELALWMSYYASPTLIPTRPGIYFRDTPPFRKLFRFFFTTRGNSSNDYFWMSSGG